MNFLLGNDILITLSTNNENIYLDNGQEQKVAFEVKVQTNPFCQAKCNSLFQDLSHNREIDNLAFTIRPGSPFYREYTLKPYHKGSGKELYQFNIACYSKKTTWCHTAEDNITRSIIITLSHDLSQEELDMKDSTKINFNQKLIQQEELEQETLRTEQLNNQIKEVLTLEVDFPAKDINRSLRENRELFNQTAREWELQDFSKVEELLKKIESNSQAISLRLEQWNQAVSPLLLQLNQAKDQVKGAQELVQHLKEESKLLNPGFITALNQTVITYNHKQELFNQKGTLGEKQQLALELENYAFSLNKSVQEEILTEKLNLEVALAIDQEVLCLINGMCVTHSFPSMGTENRYSLNQSCQRAADFLLLLTQTKASLPSSSRDVNSSTLIQNARANIDLLQSTQAKAHLNNLSRGSEIIVKALQGLILNDSSRVIDSSPTNLLVEELIRQQPSCLTYPLDLDLINLPLANFSEQESVNITPFEISLEEPSQTCPVYGEEKACCLNLTCQDDPKQYPIIFIHGHAFNKDVSTEYSLDAFNFIQNQLVEEGYLNAGAISGYSFKTDTKGIWKQIPAPFTFKGSYYYDLFEEASQYSLVQTKSENIDTYAIRLKDMIDWIKYKTGRSKVIIVAHSMGGLVARRYIQVFGSESVSQLVMIGTPNNGVVGDVADYCPVIGEQLECRDMSENSLFLNKLNREPLPEIPIYNIVGTGCETNGVDGDGVVLKEKAELPGVKNYYVEGSCSGSQLLHTDLLKIQKYPKVYQILKLALSRY